MNTENKITKLIIETPTELRGNLFRDISTLLNKNNQGYTASLFADIAIKYGIK